MKLATIKKIPTDFVRLITCPLTSRLKPVRANTQLRTCLSNCL